MKRIICVLLVLSLLFCIAPTAYAEGANNKLTVLFTHDIHDYLYPTYTYNDGEVTEHGGAARLKYLLDQNRDENTVYVDGGDFSMGTLYQTAYSTAAYELRNLGLSGCAVTTFGNHEFDYGAEGTADMLLKAINSGDPLPQIVQSNMNFNGKLTKEQKKLKTAMNMYGVKNYTVLIVGGKKIGFFGVAGPDCIDCVQSDIEFSDYIEAAKGSVKALKNEKCDFIVALSHSGTNGDRKTGEDIELARSVAGINLIISAHSHSVYQKPVLVDNTYIVSCGEYLQYLGKISFNLKNGEASLDNYSLIPINSFVPEDPDTAQLMEQYKQEINADYLANEGVTFDDVVCHSKFNLMGVNDMYATHQEYTMGNIIADSYMYEAKRNGITDIDVALVGLGTIRSSIRAGNMTVADVFEICSLGVGGDKTAGHPLVAAYITGKELKLLAELDASLGTYVSSIKMSYSGLSYEFNTKRVVLDRVTKINLIKENGNTEKIENKKLYKVVANMYAINMLGMLNDLTGGVLKITPKDASGKPVKNFYARALKNIDGKEIKEWVALKNFLSSFEKNAQGVSEIPSKYQSSLGRKVKVSVGGVEAIKNPGMAVKIIPVAIGVAGGIVVLLLALIIFLRIRKRRREGWQFDFATFEIVVRRVIFLLGSEALISAISMGLNRFGIFSTQKEVVFVLVTATVIYLAINFFVLRMDYEVIINKRDYFKFNLIAFVVYFAIILAAYLVIEVLLGLGSIFAWPFALTRTFAYTLYNTGRTGNYNFISIIAFCIASVVPLFAAPIGAKDDAIM